MTTTSMVESPSADETVFRLALTDLPAGDVDRLWDAGAHDLDAIRWAIDNQISLTGVVMYAQGGVVARADLEAHLAADITPSVTVTLADGGVVDPGEQRRFVTEVVSLRTIVNCQRDGVNDLEAIAAIAASKGPLACEWLVGRGYPLPDGKPSEVTIDEVRGALGQFPPRIVVTSILTHHSLSRLPYFYKEPLRLDEVTVIGLLADGVRGDIAQQCAALGITDRRHWVALSRARCNFRPADLAGWAKVGVTDPEVMLARQNQSPSLTGHDVGYYRQFGVADLDTMTELAAAGVRPPLLGIYKANHVHDPADAIRLRRAGVEPDTVGAYRASAHPVSVDNIVAYAAVDLGPADVIGYLDAGVTSIDDMETLREHKVRGVNARSFALAGLYHRGHPATIDEILRFATHRINTVQVAHDPHRFFDLDPDEW